MVLLIRTAFWLIRLLPVRAAGGLGAGLGRLAYLLDGRHRRIALRNLRRIYPDMPDTQRRHIARESLAELGRTSLELPHVFLRSREFLLSRIEIEGEEAFAEAMKQGQGVILTACHHSNWELGAQCVSMLGYKSDGIYRPLRQPGADKLLNGYRHRFGGCFHSRHDGLRWLPRALREGHCVAVMIDQHLSNGTPVPFLGHDALTTTLPAVFAGKYRTPVFGVILHRIGRSFRFRLQFWPIALDAGLDEVGIMRRICDSFAPAIHARPELWLWVHRRWLYLDEQEGIG